MRDVRYRGKSSRGQVTIGLPLMDPERTFAHPLTGLCLRYGRPSACQRDKTTSNQLDLLCKRAVPGRFGVVSTNEGVFMACTTQVQEVRSLRYLFEEYAFDTARRQLCCGPDVIAVTHRCLISLLT